MTGNGMADSIRTSMGFPTPLSAQLIGWGTAIVEHLQTAGLVNNAPGTVTGTCAPVPGPLLNGAAAGGLIAGLSGSTLANLVKTYAGYPSITSQLQGLCDAIVSHVQTMGIVSFASGNITGVCTNTPLSPGTVTGEGSGGTIAGLSGSVLASSAQGMAGFPSVTPELIAFCSGIVNYIMSDASVSYATGTVTGVAPAGGGPMTAGTGVGGTIS